MYADNLSSMSGANATVPAHGLSDSQWNSSGKTSNVPNILNLTRSRVDNLLVG